MTHLRRTFLISIIAWLTAGTAAVEPNKVQIVLQPSELLRQGNSYLEQGDTESAKKAFMRGLERNLTPRQLANMHNGMCVAHIKEEDWRTALTHCDAAIKIAPTNWRFHNNRGNIFLGLGKYEQAMKNYQKGLSMAPKSVTLATNIGILETRVASRRRQSGRTGPT